MQFMVRAAHAARQPNQSRRHRSVSLAIGVTMLMLLASMALADNLEVDGDGLVPFAPAPMNLGEICTGQSKSGNALLAIKRSGGGQVFANSAAVTVSAGTPSSADVTTSFTDNGITLPSNWSSATNNTLSSDTATSKVTVAVPNGGATGAKSATVLYTGTANISRTATLTINWTVIVCDTASPAVAITLDSPNSGAPDGNDGWFKTKPVSGTVTATDTASNIAAINCSGVTLTGLTGVSSAKTASGNFSVSAEGTTSISCTATDAASNTSSPATTTDVKIDSAAPAVNDDGPAAAADGNADWYISAVTNQFSASDPTPGSGLVGPASFTKSSGANEGSNVMIASDSASDVAGNTNPGLSAGPFKIDLTDPTVTCGSAPTFLLNQGGAQVSATVSDGQSGPAASSVSASAVTSAVGSYTAQLAGYDMAGRSTTTSCSYSVIYNWTGFFQPVENPGNGLSPVFNRVKAGSAIPTKFSLGGNQGLNIFMVGSPSSVNVTCPGTMTVDVIEETVTASNSGLSYDASSDQYNYVWKTDKAWAGKCRMLTVKLIDGTEHVAYFNFTK